MEEVLLRMDPKIINLVKRYLSKELSWIKGLSHYLGDSEIDYSWHLKIAILPKEYTTGLMIDSSSRPKDSWLIVYI